MEIHPTTEATRFVLEKGWDSRTKWLLGISACLAFVHALLGIIFFYFNSTNYDGTVNAVPLLFSLVLLIVGLRLMGSAQRKDTLIVDAESVRLCEYKSLRTTTRTFNKSEITNWRFLDKPAVSEHALAGKKFDYLGFQTQQYLIAEIAGDNRIAFDYEGDTITFGRQLYSWDFNAIMQVVENRKPETTYPIEQLKAAHQHTIYHQPEIAASNDCGCFYCLEIFPPTNITEWTDESSSEQTALCPHCGIDAVMGDASGFPVSNKDFLRAMHDYYF